MQLTREDLISVLKNKIVKHVDVRTDNSFADYSDQYDRIYWKDNYFDSLTEEQIIQKIEKYEVERV